MILAALTAQPTLLRQHLHPRQQLLIELPDLLHGFFLLLVLAFGLLQGKDLNVLVSDLFSEGLDLGLHGDVLVEFLLV